MFGLDGDVHRPCAKSDSRLARDAAVFPCPKETLESKMGYATAGLMVNATSLYFTGKVLLAEAGSPQTTDSGSMWQFGSGLGHMPTSPKMA